MAVDPHLGGTIALAQCGYSVATVPGASIPHPSSAMLGSDATPKQVHVNVAHDGRTGMAILWRTNDETTLATTVQYGTGGKTDQTQDGFTFVYDINEPDGTPASVRVHETHLCGLQPDTVYSYRVGGSDGKTSKWSPVYSFRTLPDGSKDPTASVSMLLLGDTRGGYSTWASTLTTAFGMKTPDVILFSGDAVTLGITQDDWDSWFDGAGDFLANTPMIFAHGNHESNAVNFFSLLAMPGDEQNFALDFATLHLTVANDSPANTADLTGVLATTLGKNLAANGSAKWNLLMHHKGLFTSSPTHLDDATTMRAAWQSIIDANNVDLDFNGHDHDYERSFPMRGMTAGTQPSDGTIYIVVGSAGAPLYDVGMETYTAFTESTYSFAFVDVGPSMLSLNAYRNDGSMLDTLMISK
jgi:acid phosphatase type 7